MIALALWLSLAAHAADLSLEERVQRLERAVAELQHRDPPSATAPKGVSCELRTPFDGTFRANESTEAAARAETLARCRAEAKGSLYCEAKAVDCGKK